METEREKRLRVPSPPRESKYLGQTQYREDNKHSKPHTEMEFMYFLCLLKALGVTGRGLGDYS